MRQLWAAQVEPLHLTDGTALANSVTLTDVSPAPAVTFGFTTPPLQLGVEVELWAAGEFSNTLTPTLLLGFYYGGVAGVALAATSAITTASGVTAVPWQLYYRGRIRAVGTSGSIKGQGYVNLGTSLTAFTTRPIPEVAASRTVTIDTTTSKAVTVGAQWGTASASNTLTCHEIAVGLWT